jgi:hypothetical protein
MGNLAVSYELQGDFGRAERLYLDVIAGQRRILGETHRSTSRTRLNLVAMRIKQGRYAEAEPLALLAYEGFRQSLGEDNVNTQSAITRIVKMYEEWHKPAEAAEWRAKLRAAPTPPRP